MISMTMRTLVLLLLSAPLATVLGAQQPALPAGGIAFVDMERVVREHPMTKSRMEQLDKETGDGLQKLKTDLDRARASESQLDSFAEGSPEYITQLTRIRQEFAQVEINRKVLIARLNIESARATREIYDLCKSEVGKIAKERGLLFVAMFSSAEIKGTTRTEVLSEIITRPFLYVDGSLDLTDAVLAAVKK